MKKIITIVVLIFTNASLFATDFGTKNGQQYYPYFEWSITNSTVSGNPYDLIAKATFTHSSGSRIETYMFYDANNTWKFRFSATKHGTWTFTTSSTDPDLNGHTGKINASQASENSYGFIKKDDNDPKKWARQKGPNAELEAFVPHYVMWNEGNDISSKAGTIDNDIKIYLNDHGFPGLNIPVKNPNVWTDGTNPNPAFFKDLETILGKVHAAGGVVHIWIWGDKSRGEYPSWGINSTQDKRLQRYIAARLGAIPGWSGGYGFDLWEWVNGTQLNEWHSYINQYMDYGHYMGARSNKNEYNQISEKMDFSSYELHKGAPPQPWYEQWKRVVNERPTKPSFSEDRFRVRGLYPDKDVTEEETRRGLYYSVLAGGAAAIWGYLKYPDGKYKNGGLSFQYPNKHWIKTWSTFWWNKKRFIDDMAPANTLSDGYVIHSPSKNSYVAYKENTSSIRLKITVPFSMPVIAVNTKNNYQEISLGSFSSGEHTFKLPSSSDWVIAVGNFKREILTSNFNDVKDENTLKVNLYPNPAKDNIYLESNLESSLEGTIYSTLGKELLKVDIKDGQKIDISTFEKGVYFLKYGDNTLKFFVE